MDKRTMRKIMTRALLASLATGAVIAGSLTSAPAAAAEPIQCVQNRGFWIFKGTVRTICDTAQREDQSWTRYREFWTPRHYVPYTSYCSRYSCSGSGGYWQEQTTNGIEEYVVFPTNVLADEPGHIN